MIWRNNTELYNTRLKIIMNQGGLGDMICRLPAVQYMLNNYPHITLEVYWYNYFLDLAKKVIPESPRIRHMSMDEVNLPSYPYPHVSIDFLPKFISSLKQHLVSHAYLTLMDLNPPIELMNYPQLPASPDLLKDLPVLPESYVVVTTGFTSATREWKSEHINEFVRLVKTQLELSVVFLGKSDSALNHNVQTTANFTEDVDYTQGLDLREKTDLFQAVEVMRGARAVVGLDNGLTHLAAMTEVPIVMGFTTVDPKDRLPVRRSSLGWNVATVTPHELLPCRLCQSRMNFVKWDFRKCFYDDYTCLDHITGARMYEALFNLWNRGES